MFPLEPSLNSLQNKTKKSKIWEGVEICLDANSTLNRFSRQKPITINRSQHLQKFKKKSKNLIFKILGIL